MTSSIQLSAQSAIHTYEDNQLLFYYSADEENTMQRMRQALPAMAEQQQRWFPHLQIDNKLSVFLLNKEHPMYKQLLKKTAKGVYYVDLNLVVLDAEAYSPTNNFVHEYAHFVLDQYIEQHKIDESLLPIWFLEGFANSFEWFVTNETSESISSYEPQPFSTLDELTADNHTEVYSQGFHTVLDLLNEIGSERMLTLMQKANDYHDFEIAFNEVTQLEYNTYHLKFTYDRQQFRYFHQLAQQEPQHFVYEVTQFLNEKPAVHPLTADLVELLYKAHYTLGHEQECAHYARQLSGLTRNASFLLELAHVFGDDEPHLKQVCLEEALFYGLQIHENQEHIPQESPYSLRNS